MIYLGIDFGLKHLGLSIAEGPLASPLTQYSYTSDTIAFNYLKQLIADQQVETIVIGLPEGKMQQNVKNFANKLKEFTNLPVHFQDETLSTKEAQRMLFQAHKPQKKRRLDHQAAATLILQAYLDDQPQS